MSGDTAPTTTIDAQNDSDSRLSLGYASAPQLPATFSVDLTELAEAALARSRSNAPLPDAPLSGAPMSGTA